MAYRELSKKRLSKFGKIEMGVHALMIGLTAWVIIHTVNLSPPYETDTLNIDYLFNQIRSYTDLDQVEIVFIALSPTCQYCRQSYSFYEKLIEIRDQKQARLSIVAAVDTSSNMKL